MAGRTNPKGGGGDQFHHIFVVREGAYGMHSTLKGKVIYQRARHYFSSADLSRILPKVAEGEEKNPEVDIKWTWWEKVVNYLSDWMMSRLVGLVSLREGFAPVAWSAVMNLWMNLLRKLMPSDARVAAVTQRYDQRMKQAISAYLDNDNYTADSLLEAMYMDIMDIKE